MQNGRAVNLLILFPGELEPLQVGFHPSESSLVSEISIPIVISILGRFGLPLEQRLRPAVCHLGIDIVNLGLLDGRFRRRDISLLRGGLEAFVLGLGGRQVCLGDEQLRLQLAVVEAEQGEVLFDDVTALDVHLRDNACDYGS